MTRHVPWFVVRWPFCRSRDIYIYLELPCYDKQSGGQSVNLRARIAELWRFKVRNEEKV